MTAFRGAVTAADAYHATRAAVRIEGEVLRVGNRFVKADRYREIAFVAVGNAASSQALAIVDALGERVTQGFVSGPDPVPNQVPFRSARVPKGYPGRPSGVEAAHTLLELAQGLGERDLLLALLSPGALSSLAVPDPTRTPPDTTGWFDRMAAGGATPREAALAAAVAFGGGVDGGLAASAGLAEVESIVIDRGDGGDIVGGSPTRRLDPIGRATGERLAGGPRGGPLSTPLPATVGRPVVVASPADGLRGAADVIGEKRYRPVLAELSYPDPPVAAAKRFTDRLDSLVKESAGAMRAASSSGVVAFATGTMGLLEGLDERPAVRSFLTAARSGLVHRGAVVGAFATSGAEEENDPPGGVAEAGPDGPGAPRPRGVSMHPGITDVGCLIVAVVPRPTG